MPGLSFIHLTDCHLPDHQSDKETNKKVNDFNSIESLSDVISDIKKNNLAYDFILVTGDISQAGTNEGYAIFNKLIQSLQKPVYCLPGNHDSTETLKKYFPTTPNQAISVNMVKQHLLILLNSKILNDQAGEISANQLKQLESILTTNNNRPVIVAMHHHPISTNSLWLDNIKLKNGDVLLNLLGKFKEVKIALFGHVHQEIDIKSNNIRLIGSPSTSYQFKPGADTNTRDILESGYRIVKLFNDEIDTQVYRLKPKVE